MPPFRMEKPRAATSHWMSICGLSRIGVLLALRQDLQFCELAELDLCRFDPASARRTQRPSEVATALTCANFEGLNWEIFPRIPNHRAPPNNAQRLQRVQTVQCAGLH